MQERGRKLWSIEPPGDDVVSGALALMRRYSEGLNMPRTLSVFNSLSEG